jgi:hypothetical protein
MMPSFESFLETFETGHGLWNPLVWGVAIIIAFLVIFIIRSLGKRDYKKDTAQTQVFLSGNPELEKEQMHVKGSNVYWGFMETLKWLYNGLDKMHNGNVNDYLLWFVIILGIFFLVLGVL